MASVPASYIKNLEIDADGEILAILGVPAIVGKAMIPAPSLGVFSLLEVIESRFFINPTDCDNIDFYRAAWISYHAARAVGPVAVYKATRDFALIDKHVINFAAMHKLDDDPDGPAKLWEQYEIAFNGFNRIPKAAGASETHLFGAGGMANVLALARGTITNWREAIWDMPLCLVGYMAAQRALENGVTGVGVPKDPADIKKQLKEARDRDETGKLHPWQREKPDIYPLYSYQIKLNPNAKDEYDRLKKDYLEGQKKK